jgi:hypothetical protein
VLAPSGSENGLGAGLTRASGQVLYYPYREGASVRVHVGALRISGPELANPLGSEDDVLVCVGPMVVGGPLERVGFRQLVVLGSLVAPAGSEPVLAGRALLLSGDLVTYTAPPRMFNGRDSFSGTFFELLPEPVTLVLNGRFVFEDDVQPDGLKQKVAAIVLDGSIVAPRRLVPLLQVLAIARSGSITASDTLA